MKKLVSITIMMILVYGTNLHAMYKKDTDVSVTPISESTATLLPWLLNKSVPKILPTRLASLKTIGNHAIEFALVNMFSSVVDKITDTAIKTVISSVSEPLQSATCNRMTCCCKWLYRQWLNFKWHHPALGGLLPNIGILATTCTGLAYTKFIENEKFRKSAYIAFPLMMAWKGYSIYRLGKRISDGSFLAPQPDQQRFQSKKYLDICKWPLTMQSMVYAYKNRQFLFRTLRQKPALLIYGDGLTQSDKLNMVRFIAHAAQIPLFIITMNELINKEPREIIHAIQLNIKAAYNYLELNNKHCAIVCIDDLALLAQKAPNIYDFIKSTNDNNKLYDEHSDRTMLIGLDNTTIAADTTFNSLFEVSIQCNEESSAAGSSTAPISFSTQGDWFCVNHISDQVSKTIAADKSIQPIQCKELEYLHDLPSDIPPLDHLPGIPPYLINMAKTLSKQQPANRVSDNILLWGPAGTGKTWLAQAFAKTCNLPVYVLNATELADSTLNLNPATIFELLGKQAAQSTGAVKRAILILDECDILFKPLKDTVQDSHAQLVSSQLRTLLSGAHPQSKSIMVIATCNGNPATELDATLTRDQRFHKINVIAPISMDAVGKILMYHLQTNNFFTPEQHPQIISQLSEYALGLTQAQLCDLVRSAMFELDSGQATVEAFVAAARQFIDEKKICKS